MPLPITLAFGAGTNLLSLSAPSKCTGISYGVMTLPFVYADPAHNDRSGYLRDGLREIPVKGFRADAHEKDMGQITDRRLDHGAGDAKAGDIRSYRPRPASTAAQIKIWIRQLLTEAESGQRGNGLYRLNQISDDNFTPARFPSRELNACFIRTYLGIGEYPMLNLLLLGSFPSFFLRKPYEDSGNTVLRYLSVVREEAWACALLDEVTIGTIPTHTGTYIVSS